MGRIAGRFMPDGLPVAADGHNILGGQFFLSHQRHNGVCKQMPQSVIQLAQLRERERLPLANGQYCFFQCDGDGPGKARQLRHAMLINNRQHHIHAIKAGS